MAQTHRTRTAILVDDDFAFLFWLAGIFTEVGCDTLPALSYQQAVLHANIFEGQVDFLVVNPALPRALEIVEMFGGMHRPKVILIPEQGVEPDTRIIGDAILERPDPHAAISRPLWVERVRRLLTDLERGRKAQ